MDKATQSLERSLRQKFVRISFSVVFGVIVLILVVVNGFNYHQVEKKAAELLDIIANNGGVIPLSEQNEGMSGVPREELPETPREEMAEIPLEEMLPPLELPLRPETNQPRQFHILVPLAPNMHEELSFTTRYFTVKFSQTGEVVSVDTTSVNRINVPDAITMAREVYDLGNSNHLEEYFYFQAVPLDTGETMVIFVDVNEDLYYFQSFFYISVCIGTVVLLAVHLLLVCLSRKIVSPIVEAYAGQKKFITDMSHELKTPLAIIKANTEVLELEHGPSSWTVSVHKQVEKLNYLVIRLLSLAKLEEESIKGEPKEFSLSDMVRESGENISVLLSAQGKSLELAIEENINFYGDPVGMVQLLDILLENASKYSPEAGTVSLQLKKEKHSILLVIENQGDKLKKGSYDSWFQRFYREENSRNSDTGGFGLGLSLAKTLVKSQDGKISAYSSDGKTVKIKVEFKV
ncbi:MAG: HAMP domain-containing sensor histidine kinase [Eubacteriales bacterium]